MDSIYIWLPSNMADGVRSCAPLLHSNALLVSSDADLIIVNVLRTDVAIFSLGMSSVFCDCCAALQL